MTIPQDGVATLDQSIAEAGENRKARSGRSLSFKTLDTLDTLGLLRVGCVRAFHGHGARRSTGSFKSSWQTSLGPTDVNRLWEAKRAEAIGSPQDSSAVQLLGMAKQRLYKDGPRLRRLSGELSVATGVPPNACGPCGGCRGFIHQAPDAGPA